MKNTIAAAAAIAFTLMFSPMAAPPARAAVDVSFDFFYSNLSPHGSWLASASYGRVWQPQVYRPGWNPYYDGHWQYADVGWVWVSDYSWGAVPYHYGTWVMDADYGWVWVPGYTWAPAWVVFRQGPEAVGWAPVSPEFSIGISFGSRSYYEPPAEAFIFVPVREFAAPRIRPYVVSRQQTNVYVRNTTVINNLTLQNNVIVNKGPDPQMVARVSGRAIRPEPLERVPRVAPFQGFSRQQIAVPAQRQGTLRAAQPELPPGMTTNRYNPTQEQNRQRLDQLQRDREQRTVPPDQQRSPQQPREQQAQQQQQRPVTPQDEQQRRQQQAQQQQQQQRPVTPQDEQQRRQQQAQQQTKDQKVVPQPIPPDEPRPLPPPRPNQPRPPAPQPPPRMEPAHPTPQEQRQNQGQAQGQQQQQQQQQQNNKNNKNKKKPPADKQDKKDQPGNGENHG